MTSERDDIETLGKVVIQIPITILEVCVIGLLVEDGMNELAARRYAREVYHPSADINVMPPEVQKAIRRAGSVWATLQVHNLIANG